MELTALGSAVRLATDCTMLPGKILNESENRVEILELNLKMIFQGLLKASPTVFKD